MGCLLSLWLTVAPGLCQLVGGAQPRALNHGTMMCAGALSSTCCNIAWCCNRSSSQQQRRQQHYWCGTCWVLYVPCRGAEQGLVAAQWLGVDPPAAVAATS